MRLTVIGQMIEGLAAEFKPDDIRSDIAAAVTGLTKHLESVKWNLRHGNERAAHR